jgi:iron complex transport system permease protein
MIIRIPRTILGLAVGGGLSVAGVVIQSTLSNPMADPYTLGIASAAALGAFVGNFIFHGRFGGNTLFAFIFSLLYLFFFLKLLKNRFTDTTQMILTGVICGFFLTAITTFFEAISDPSMWGQQLNWLLGSLTSLPLDQSIFTLVIIILISIICWIHWKPLDVLSVDTLSAMNVGLNIETYRKRFYLLVSLLTAISVSVAGIVGFIGFIIPHTIRLMGIQTHRLLIPCSFFCRSRITSFCRFFF